MIGMYPPNKDDGTVRPSSTGMFQTLATEARSMAHEEVGPGDENRVFYRLPVWKKIIVMLGGPGHEPADRPRADGGPADGLRHRHAHHHHRRCLQVPGGGGGDRGSGLSGLQADARRRRAGLKPNDVITSFDGKAVTSWDQLTDGSVRPPGREVSITVERDGAPVTTTVTPVLSARPVVGADGRQAKDDAGNLLYQDVGFLGIGAQTALVPQPASSVLPMAGENIQQVAGVVLNLPARVVGVAKAAFSEEPRDPNGPISVVGVGRVAGEVAAMEEVPLQSRLAALVGLLAGLNFALAVFNLVPLLPLDGGHVAGALYEGARRRVAKLFGKPDPGAFDIAKLLPVTYVVAALLMGMSALLIYADIVKPVNLFG